MSSVVDAFLSLMDCESFVPEFHQLKSQRLHFSNGRESVRDRFVLMWKIENNERRKKRRTDGTTLHLRLR